MRAWGLRLLGTALILYGLVGCVLLGLLGSSIVGPLDEVGRLAESVTEQRDAALEALDEASSAARDTAATVRGMDTSLVEARGATDRAAGLSAGMAQTMRELSAAMALDIFGIQPLIGLAPGFDASAQNLDLLSGDLADIGTALETTRSNAEDVAVSVDSLAESVEELRVAVAGSPDMSVTLGARESLQLGLLALFGWLFAGAIGCIVAGLGCWVASRRRPVVVRTLERVETLD